MLLFKTISVTTADKGNDHLMLISTGCSVTSVFHPCKMALVNTSVNVEAEWGGGLKILNLSTFGTALWRDKPILKKDNAASSMSLCF